MKKYILTTIVAATLIAPVSFALASSMAFDKATVNVNANQVFTATVSIDPQSAKNYTVKLVLDYPAETLQVTSFNFAGNWTQLNQPGYDLIDNTKGSLIKTAGYPGGFNTPKTFGTITFRALKGGSALVKVNSSSMVLDGTNQNTLTGSPSFSVAVASPVPTPTPAPQPTPQPTPNPVAITPTPTPTPTPTTTVTNPTPTTEIPTQTAAVASTQGQIGIASLLDAMNSNRNNILIVIALLLIIAGVTLVVMKRMKGATINTAKTNKTSKK